MKQMRKQSKRHSKKQFTRTAALATASASVVVLGLVAPVAASAASTASAGPLEWSECEGSGLDPRQECATVLVPMDYADPGGPKIGIAVSRIPGEKPGARRGALLLIPGGPGGSSLADPSQKGQRLPQGVRDAYDLIGFAPRGNAPSAPVDCGLDHADLALSRLRPWPAADGSVAENMATARRTADACARNGGELLRHISTADNARDIDRVRAALGERRISAWGVSYGTYVGAVYSELFPHRTDRIVLDSNLDPTGDFGRTQVSRAWLAGFEQGVEDVFAEFAKWASEPGNPDRVADTPAEVRSVFLGLAARLDRTPLPWPGANPEVLNGTTLRQTMLDSFYDPDDFPTLARVIRAGLQGAVPPAPQTPPESVLQNAVAVGAATICNDSAWPTSAAVYEKGVAESRVKYPLTSGMPRNAMVCAAWPRPRQQPVRITGRGPSNILLVQNERDVATPLAGARKLRAALGDRAVMVTVNATGHDSYSGNGNACGDETVSLFLSKGERPSRDVYCE
ncbi:alpha/beta hydrolase [Streptomyces sp. NBC_01275]|uniref:alpha/beta hydrolase n=1 Tax=Streptomyces sp. NBC_01275 TaxID=2903807 RepID=UPI002259BB23|nr:alpha/beta hydrolase [Streptomyces sp. NBC_01275]MCX4767136.1 alpha/beta hydrolase [Streptomyces sp. NBC_01275]